MEYFNCPKINYEGSDSKNPFAFKHYDADAVIDGKTMKEHLRFAACYWHNFCSTGFDIFGEGIIILVSPG